MHRGERHRTGDANATQRAASAGSSRCAAAMQRSDCVAGAGPQSRILIFLPLEKLLPWRIVLRIEAVILASIDIARFLDRCTCQP